MSTASFHLPPLSSGAGAVPKPPRLSAALVLRSGATSSVQQEWLDRRRPGRRCVARTPRRGQQQPPDAALDLITLQSQSRKRPLPKHPQPQPPLHSQPQQHRLPQPPAQLRAAPPQQQRPPLRRPRGKSRRTLRPRQQSSSPPPDVFGLPPLAAAINLQPRSAAAPHSRRAGDSNREWAQCVICLEEKPVRRMLAGGFCSCRRRARASARDDRTPQVAPPPRAEDAAAAEPEDESKQQRPGERAERHREPHCRAHEPACWASAVCMQCAKQCIGTQLGEHGRMRAGRVPPTVRCPICPGRPALVYGVFRHMMSGAQRERFEEASRSCLRFFCGGCHQQTELFVNGAREPLVAKEGVLGADLARRLRTELLPAFCGALSDGALGDLLDAIAAEASAAESTPLARSKLLAHVAARIESPERRATFMLAFLRRWPKFRTPCCSKVHCFNCHIVGFHDNQSCAQYQARQTRDVNVVSCAACGLHLVKGDGCSSVRCVCGHKFTWSKRAREVAQEVVRAFTDHIIGLRNRSDALPPTVPEITLEATIVVDAGKAGDPRRPADRGALGWTPELQEQGRVYLAHQKAERSVGSPEHALADLFAGPLLAGSLVVSPNYGNQVLAVAQDAQCQSAAPVHHERHHHTQEGEVGLEVPRQRAHGVTTWTVRRRLVAHSRPASVRLLRTLQARSIMLRANELNVSAGEDKMGGGLQKDMLAQLSARRREIEIQAKARAWLSCNPGDAQLARAFEKRMKFAFQTTFRAQRFERMCDAVLADGNGSPPPMTDTHALTALMVDEQGDQPMKAGASHWLALHGFQRARRLVAHAFGLWHAKELQHNSSAGVAGVLVSSELRCRASQLEAKLRNSETREANLELKARTSYADFEALMLDSVQILHESRQNLADLLRMLKRESRQNTLWFDACGSGAVTSEPPLLQRTIANTIPFVRPEFWQNLQKGEGAECLFFGSQGCATSPDPDAIARAAQRRDCLPKEQIEALRAAFTVCDKDRSGQLTAQDLRAVMRELGHTPTDTEVREMIDAADTSGSSTIDFNEFVGMVARGGDHGVSAGVTQPVLDRLVERHLRLRPRDLAASGLHRGDYSDLRRLRGAAPAAVLDFIASLRNFDPHGSSSELSQLVKAAKATSAFWCKSRLSLESIDQPVINGLRKWLAAMHGYVAQLVVSVPLLEVARSAHLALKEARAARLDVARDLGELNCRMVLDTAQQLDEVDHNRRSFACDGAGNCSGVAGSHDVDERASWADAQKRTLFASKCYARAAQAGECLEEHAEVCASSRAFEAAALSISGETLQHLQNSGLHLGTD